MSASSTRAPSATNRRASASPWPRAAPVMIATLPSRRPIVVLLRCRRWPGPWSRRRLVGADDPHGEELRAATVGVAQGDPGAVDLVLAGPAPDLQRRLGEADEARRADGVGRQHPAGGVPGDVAVHGRGPLLDELPARALLGEAEVLQPHRLVPRERHVDLGDVDVPPGVGDAGLAVDVGGALPAGPGVHLV